MYTTCLFCHADLGRNEAIEAFPVGRRLAYDADKGRLWVVCRRCERWNLTPQEERWEAIEQAERRYRGTRLRASTDNVGLARLPDGTELVRIGRPLRPEFAAWRYGDQFGRRRRRRIIIGAGAATAAVTLVVAGPVMGFFSLAGLTNAHHLFNALNGARRARRGIVVTDGERHERVRVSIADAERTRLVPDPDGGFAMVLPAAKWRWYHVWTERASTGQTPDVRLVGPAALLSASRLLPHVNSGGGDRLDVRSAVDLLDAAGGPEALFEQLARDGRRFSNGATWAHQGSDHGPTLGGLTRRAALALEMAAHEEQERRAFEGELAELEAAWQQAEEIAAIADDLLLPEGLTTKLDQLRGRSSARAGAASSPPSDSGGATSS